MTWISSFLVFLLISWLDDVCGHTRGTDTIYYFDATMPAGTTRCGPHTLTGWTVRRDRYWGANGANGDRQDGVYFNAGTGTFTCPTIYRIVNGAQRTAQGIFRCCASARCRKGGYCDFTLVREDGSVSGAFGRRMNSEWSSHEVCILERMTAGNTLKVVLQSGAGSDCLEETGWNYVRFSCNLATIS